LSTPINRQQFRDFCLRKLGAPILNIDLTSEMIEDRIDQAIQYFQEFHVEGTRPVYYSYQIQPVDITNQYFILPPSIIGIGKLFDVASTFGATDIFSITYQVALSEMWNLSSIPVAPYWMALQNIQWLQQVLVGQKPVRFSRYEGILHIDMDWNQVAAGDFLVVEAFQVNDPALLPLIWSDIFLQKYATALIKRNWGSVLSKYQEMPLTGGLKVNAKQICDEADAEIEALEQQMMNTWSLPIGILIG